MYPELFNFGEFTLHSYGFFIGLGTYLSFLFLSKSLNKSLSIPEDDIVKLFLLLIIVSFVGGKVFFYLEDFSFYVENPKYFIRNIGNGFVFYGSLIFTIPTMILFFKKQKWPVWEVLDHMAITVCIVHLFGRIGCFMAGCCYGLPTDLPWGITYSNPICAADPLNVPLHPTQIYEVMMILCIGLFLFYLLKYKHQFNGQIFLTYLILYSIGRSIIEVYRGDVARGFIVDDWISHSQGISIVLIVITVFIYLNKRKEKEKNNY